MNIRDGANTAKAKPVRNFVCADVAHEA